MRNTNSQLDNEPLARIWWGAGSRPHSLACLQSCWFSSAVCSLPRSPGLDRRAALTHRQTERPDRVQLARHGSSERNRCARDFDLGEDVGEFGGAAGPYQYEEMASTLKKEGCWILGWWRMNLPMSNDTCEWLLELCDPTSGALTDVKLFNFEKLFYF